MEHLKWTYKLQAYKDEILGQECISVVEHLPDMHEVLGSIPSKETFRAQSVECLHSMQEALGLTLLTSETRQVVTPALEVEA